MFNKGDIANILTAIKMLFYSGNKHKKCLSNKKDKILHWIEVMCLIAEGDSTP